MSVRTSFHTKNLEHLIENQLMVWVMDFDHKDIVVMTNKAKTPQKTFAYLKKNIYSLCSVTFDLGGWRNLIRERMTYPTEGCHHPYR